MIQKFSLYDLIANLIPGALFLWGVEFLGRFVGWTSPLQFSGDFAESSVLIAMSYVTGVMLQALSYELFEKRSPIQYSNMLPSERWLLPEDEHFSRVYKDRILALIEERFKVSTKPDISGGTKDTDKKCDKMIQKNNELFYLCYTYVDNLSSRPQTFSAKCGSFRCLFLLFCILGLLSTGLGLWNLFAQDAPHHTLWVLPFLCGSLAWLCYRSGNEYGEIFARSVYDLFVADVPKPK
jgi:hypothetical protein